MLLWTEWHVFSQIEEVHPDTDYETNSKPTTPLISKDFVFSSEPYPYRLNNFPSLNGHDVTPDRQQLKERKYSVDELEEKYLRLQEKLNLEKKDRDLATSRVELIAKENSRLKSELSKLKDENKQLSNKLNEHTFIISQAMNNSRTNSTSGAASRARHHHNVNVKPTMSYDINVNSLV